MMLRTIFLSTLLFITGCSHIDGVFNKKMATKTFSFDKLWVRNTLNSDYYGFRHTHRMSPILYSGMIVQGNAIDGISVYDSKTGNLKWFKNISGGIEAGAIIENDIIFAGASDGYFYSLDIFSGTIKWKTPIQAETLSAPIYFNGRIFFIAGNNRLYCLEGTSGKVVWTYSRQETSSFSIRGGSQPAIYKDSIYAGFSDGFLVSIDINDGKLKWEKSVNKHKRFRDVDSKPVFSEERVYVTGFDQSITALNSETGSVYWQHDQGGYSSVVINNNNLYYSTTDGYVISMDKNSGKILWKYKLKSSLGTEPVLFRGLLIFGEYEGDLIALDEVSGKVVGTFSTGRGIMSKPFVDSKTGTIYFISVDANLYSLKMEWKALTDKWPWEKVL